MGEYNSVTILFLVLLSTVCNGEKLTDNEKTSYSEIPSVKRYREYVQIDTSVMENLPEAVEFWRRQAFELELPFAVYEPAGLPICVIKWQGTEPTLPSIMLNSHMDVVPAEAEYWIHPPFSAYMDDNGDIYGRGTQDTKDTAIQYLEAIGKLKRNNISLTRTVYITLMPDEETGGHQGLGPFSKTDEFKAMNVGFTLDEGLCNTDGVYLAMYYDKRPWQFTFRVKGPSGHGSGMPEDTAVSRVQKLLKTIMEYRRQQMHIMRSTTKFDYGAYTTININLIKGGEAINIIPNLIELSVDMRLAKSANVTDMMILVNSWKLEAGNETTVDWIQQVNISSATAVDDSNIYWTAMMDAAKELGITIMPIVNPAKADVLTIRNLGIPGIGFSTKINTIPRMHANNEYLNVKTFLNGIDTFFAMLKKLGNLKSSN